jgi:hypothetical protein
MHVSTLLTLQELLDKVIGQGALKPSRLGPMRTAVKQYAAILDADPAHCRPEVYYLPEAQFRQIITTHAPATLGPHEQYQLPAPH